MGNGPPFTQNGRMRIISAFPFGTTGRVHSGSGDLAAMGPAAGGVRGPPGPGPALYACANSPGWPARAAPRGLWRIARSQAHAHVHSTCAARVALAHDIAHVASELTLRATPLCSCPPGLPAAPAPGYVRSGQGRAPGAAPDTRLHTSQLPIRGRRHLRVALEIAFLISSDLL